MFANDDARRQLTEVLQQPRQALLLVGSGSSQFVGYPSWPDLLNQLREEVIPEEPFPSGLDFLAKASFVQAHLRQYHDSEDRHRQYRQHLEATFRPRPQHNYDDFHRTLAQMPFCGVATTNYDSVLELAIGSVRAENALDVQCHPIDLCIDRPHRVFEFLRGLSAGDALSSVLHIHGYWEHPEDIVLTSADYTRRYGLRNAHTTHDAGVAAEPTRDLDTLHRKVVWSLLTMRPVVFVGFSLDDPAFLMMLDLVKKDFDLPLRPPPHFALLPSQVGVHQNQQQQDDAVYLSRIGVLPVFYQVTIDGNGRETHDALPTLIEELGAELRTPGRQSSLADISRRLLAR